MKKYFPFVLYNIFSITIFISAFLLFQVQPLIGKYILPWFGGASFVWVTSLLFFQLLLLAGYLYSFVVTKLKLKQQVYIHLLLIITSVSIIIWTFTIWKSPLTPDVSWKLSDTFPPTIQILQILTISVGIPYFILSITSTLLQRWFSNFEHAKTPYSLYSVSNAGSLLGIIAYPFVIEPLFSIKIQATLWSFLFIFYSILMLVVFFLTAKSTLKNNAQNIRTKTHNSFHRSAIFTWLALPAVSSIMLLSSSNQLTQTIAPIPFLWLVPLGLYLLSFIICFDSRYTYMKQFYAWGFLILIPVILSILYSGALLGILPEVAIYSIFLFFCFMLCHGELYNSRPDPQHLNLFYLLIALGSAIGSSIVAIAAPILFKGIFWEFMLGLFLTSLVAAIALLRNKDSFLSRLHFFTQKERTIFIISVLCTFFLIIAALNYATQASSSLGIWRNFYGTIRVNKEVRDDHTILCIINGKINHGCQVASGPLRNKPIIYYGDKSGVGIGMQILRERAKKSSHKNFRIGIIGLGAGNLAVYGNKGDYIKFYELNPLDVDIARKHFSYLRDAEATIDIAVGDGRLSLEKELQENKNQQFDFFIIDAFSDDAIPIHLLTKEAFDTYRKHLKPDGLIAIHISTQYINLKPPMMKLAEYSGMKYAIIESQNDDGLNVHSRWALFSYDTSLINNPTISKAKLDLSKQPTISLWTDDYSNLFQLLNGKEG